MMMPGRSGCGSSPDSTSGVGGKSASVASTHVACARRRERERERERESARARARGAAPREPRSETRARGAAARRCARAARARLREAADELARERAVPRAHEAPERGGDEVAGDAVREQRDEAQRDEELGRQLVGGVGLLVGGARRARRQVAVAGARLGLDEPLALGGVDGGHGADLSRNGIRNRGVLEFLAALSAADTPLRTEPSGQAPAASPSP